MTMILRSIVVAAAVGLTAPQLALGQGKTVTVQVPDFDFLYRFEVGRTDDGVKKESRAHTDRPETTVALRDFSLGLSGRVDSAFTYRVLVDLVGSDGQRFDLGYVRWLDPSKRWDVTVGQQKINVYGFEAKEHSALTVIDSVGFENKPFEYAPAVMLAYRTPELGSLSLQVVQDASPAAGWDADAHSTEQTATVLEWLTAGFALSDGRLSPLFELASYDIGHSKLVSAGLKYASKTLVVTGDYVYDNFGAKGAVADASGHISAKNFENIKTTAVLAVEYESTDLSPFAHASIFDYRDHTEPGQDEPKVNATTDLFNDNGKVLGLGVYLNSLSKKLRPYAAFVQRSGNFAGSDGNAEQKSVDLLKVGLEGRF